jgi:aminocarboxymuconate-semialdehyde decarboxylase
VDSLVHDAAALRSLLALFGDRRVALGSDYPFPLGEETPGNLVEQLTDLSPEMRRRVLFETPAEFLGIDVAPRPAERSARDEF